MKKNFFIIAFLSYAICLCAADSSKTKRERLSSASREEVVGNVKVIVEAKNLDEVSQRRAEWRSKQKKRESDRKKSKRSEDKEEEEDDSPQVSLKIKWPAKG